MAIWWKLSLTFFLISLVYCQFLPMESDLRVVFSDFEKRHIVDSIQGNIKEWNELLKLRIGKEYGRKSVNSFVVSTSSDVKADFSKSKKYKFNNDTASDLYWSLNARRIFDMIRKSNSSYDVYDCKNQYYVAALPDKLPVHFEGHESGIIPWTLADFSDIRATCDKLST